MKTNLIVACTCLVILSLSFGTVHGQQAAGVMWKHLSSANGDIEVPNPGMQQTATAVLDVDKDGVNDFIITERSEAPSVVWYRRTKAGWDRYVVDAAPLRIEAGSSSCDIDRDGDLDIVFGGKMAGTRRGPCMVV